MVLRKVYNPHNNKFEWALVSKSNPRKVLEYFGLKRPNKERFISAERRVQFYKSLPKIKVFKHYSSGIKNGGQHYYVSVLEKAKNKGYTLPNKKHLHIAETDIPPQFYIDGFTLPIEQGWKKWSKKESRKYKDMFLIGIDDDASKENKEKALAHEIGHVHLYVTGKKPHTEHKAEKIAADILGVSIEELNDGIIFDNDWKKPGIQLPKTRRK